MYGWSGMGDTILTVPTGSYNADYSTGCPKSPACQPWEHIVGSPIASSSDYSEAVRADARAKYGVCRCTINPWAVGGAGALLLLMMFFKGGR